MGSAPATGLRRSATRCLAVSGLAVFAGACGGESELVSPTAPVLDGVSVTSASVRQAASTTTSIAGIPSPSTGSVDQTTTTNVTMTPAATVAIAIARTRLIVTLDRAVITDTAQFATDLESELAEHGTVTQVFAASGQLLVEVDEQGRALLAEHALVASLTEDTADPPDG